MVNPFKMPMIVSFQNGKGRRKKTVSDREVKRIDYQIAGYFISFISGNACHVAGYEIAANFL